jgi:hypothetical protein
MGGPRPGFGGPLGFGGLGAFGSRQVVTNEPYSGTAVTTFTQTLANGNTITHSSCEKIYRDSSGRTRREETPNATTCSATPVSIMIVDPVAGVQYLIDPHDNTYRQLTFKAPPAGSTPPSRPNPPADSNVVTKDLGTKTISGVTVQGTETDRTIPAGQIGNAQPIVITSTRWYSPDLQIVIQSTRTDPRAGNSSYLLSDVSRAEPAATLFQLPSGLTQKQGRGRFAR